MIESNKVFQARAVSALSFDEVESLRVFLRTFSGRHFRMFLKTGKLFISTFPQLDYYLLYTLPEGFYKGKDLMCGFIRLRHFDRDLKHRGRELDYEVDSVTLWGSEKTSELEKMIADQGPHIAFGIAWAEQGMRYALRNQCHKDRLVAAELIATRIVMLRKERGWSQTTLAQKLGKSKSVVAKLEKPQEYQLQYLSETVNEHLRRLAEIFETTVEHLKGS